MSGHPGASIDCGTASLLTSALRENRLFDLREINIAFVLPKKPGDRAQAYAQGHWMYEYIVRRFGVDAERCEVIPLDIDSEKVRKLIKKVGEDIDAFKFNTAISAM